MATRGKENLLQVESVAISHWGDDLEKKVHRSTSPPNRPLVGGYLCAALLVAYAIYLLCDLPEAADLRLGQLTLTALTLIGATLLATWSGLAAAQLHAVETFAEVLHELRDTAGNIAAVQKDHYKLRAELQGFLGEVQQFAAGQAQFANDLGEAFLNRRQYEQMLIELRQEVNHTQRQSEGWERSAVAFLKALERALKMPDLEPMMQRAYQKQADDMQQLFQATGLAVIRPEPGAAFDDRLHQAEGSEPAAGLPVDSVAACLDWGYRNGDRLIEPAKVRLVAEPPEEPESDPSA